MTLCYRIVTRVTRLVEVDGLNYSRWQHNTSYERAEVKIIRTEKDLKDLWVIWKDYCESGYEGEEKAEGGGWFFYFFIRLGNTEIDVTDAIKDRFEHYWKQEEYEEEARLLEEANQKMWDKINSNLIPCPNCNVESPSLNVACPFCNYEFMEVDEE